MFRIDAIEALRQPLESGDISVARAEESVTLPARGIVVLAANPCPCGGYHQDVKLSHCDCRENVRRDYRRKLSGPITDRIDVVRHLSGATRGGGVDPLACDESSAVVRERVQAARDRQTRRYLDTGWRLNGHVPGPVLRERWPLAQEAERYVDEVMWKGSLTRRGVSRVHRWRGPSPIWPGSTSPVWPRPRSPSGCARASP